MARLVILGSWHAGACCTQFARAAAQEGHEVVRVGPRFTEVDAARWAADIAQHLDSSPEVARAYAQDVLRQSPAPQIETTKGELWPLGQMLWVPPDAVIVFDQYGETPRLNHGAVTGPTALVCGDTHTGHLERQRRDAGTYDHVFVQFRRADLVAFAHPSQHWLPAAADPDVWRPLPLAVPEADLVFVGSCHPAVHAARVQLIEHLRRQGLDVMVAHRFGAEGNRLLQRGWVALNRSLAGDLNLRVMETLCAGRPLLTDRVDGLEPLGLVSPQGELLYCYNTPEEATALARRLLDDPGERRSLGETGAAYVRQHHTWRHRVRELLDVVLDGKEGQWDERRPLASHGGAPGRAGAAPGGNARSAPEHHSATSPATGSATSLPPALSAPVTLIIPALNHWEDCTGPLLEHLSENRTWLHDAQILIVDDGSTDATARLGPEDWTGFVWEVLHLPTNDGFAAACNAGAAAAQGHVLVFLNNDTTPQGDWLTPLLQALVTGAVLAGPLLRGPDGRTQSAGLWQQPDGTWLNDDRPPRGAASVPVAALCGACLAVRRDRFWQLGGFDEGFAGGGGCEDVDLALRVRQLWGEEAVVLVPASVVLHEEGTTRFARPETRAQLAANQRRLRERWGDEWQTDAGNESRGLAPLVGSGREHDARAGTVGAADLDASRRLRADRTGFVLRLGRATPAARPVIVWEGRFESQTAGSLAHINRQVVDALQSVSRFHVVPLPCGSENTLAADTVCHVSHYWTGTDAAWRPPPDCARHWMIVAPWELSRYPASWDAAFRHPRFRRLLTPSEQSRRLFLAEGVLRPEQVRVVPNGVDTAAFHPDGPVFPTRAGSEGLWVALFVGGLLWRKGVDLLYAAWDRAFTRDEPVRLVLKAQGTQTFYRGQALLPPKDHATIRLLERHLPPAELATLYRAASVVVLPSRAEGFGLSALEGMASGRPVVIPEGTAMAEFVPPGAGLLVPSTDAGLPSGAVEPDIDLLARALRWCYEHRDEAAARGAAGRQAALAYDWARIAGRYAEEIEEVCH